MDLLEGMLASIADPYPTIAWDGISHLYDDKQFFLSEKLRKNLKLKGELPCFISFKEAIESATEMLAHFQQL